MGAGRGIQIPNYTGLNRKVGRPRKNSLREVLRQPTKPNETELEKFSRMGNLGEETYKVS
jgi:hypothetical protein